MIIIALLVYSILNFYVGKRAVLLLTAVFPKINNHIFWILYIMCALCIFIGYAVPRFKFTKIAKIISGYYMSTFLYLLIIAHTPLYCFLLLEPSASYLMCSLYMPITSS